MEKIPETIDITLNALKQRGFDARYAENREVARKIIVSLVQENWIGGCGGSTTVGSLGVIRDLVDTGSRVLNPTAGG